MLFSSYRREPERVLGALSADEVEQLDRAIHRLLEARSDDARERV